MLTKVSKVSHIHVVFRQRFVRTGAEQSSCIDFLKWKLFGVEHCTTVSQTELYKHFIFRICQLSILC